MPDLTLIRIRDLPRRSAWPLAPVLALAMPAESRAQNARTPAQAAPAAAEDGSAAAQATPAATVESGVAQDTVAAADDQAARDGREIVVTARRRSVDERIDRTTYDIAAGPDAASTGLLDVLRRLPGVFVGPSGGVTIRGGSRVSYLVDGKPARREIAEAIPAGQIERIEVIPNPPAEYDSSSEALINIVLRRDADAGWSGSASGGADTLGGMRTGLDVAFGGRGWNLNGNASYRSTPLATIIRRETDFLPTMPDEAPQSQVLSIEEDRRTKRLGGQMKAFRRSAVDNSTSLLIGTSYNRIPQRQLVTQTISSAAGPSIASLRRDIDFTGFYPYANVTLTRVLADKLSLDLALQVNRGDSRETRRTFGDIRQLVVDDIDFTFVEPSLKLTRKLGKGQVGIGLSYSLNPVADRLRVGAVPEDTVSAAVAYDFRVDRDIYAGFVEYSGELLGVGFKPSVRVERIEQRFSNFDLPVRGLRRVDRLLPSVHLSRKLGERGTLKASFTARTDRPDGLNLNPFVAVISPFFVRTGNPFLRPSTKRQFDLSYVSERAGLSINQSFYFRTTRDDISEFLLSDDAGVTTNSFTNLGSSKTYGYTVTAKGNIARDLQFGVGSDLFRRELVAPTSLSTLGRVAFTSANMNGTLDLKLDARTSASAQLAYTGPVSDISIRTPRYFTSEFQARRVLGGNLVMTLVLADMAIPLDRLGRFEGLNLVGRERTRSKSRLVRIGLAAKL